MSKISKSDAKSKSSGSFASETDVFVREDLLDLEEEKEEEDDNLRTFDTFFTRNTMRLGIKCSGVVEFEVFGSRKFRKTVAMVYLFVNLKVKMIQFNALGRKDASLIDNARSGVGLAVPDFMEFEFCEVGDIKSKCTYGIFKEKDDSQKKKSGIVNNRNIRNLKLIIVSQKLKSTIVISSGDKDLLPKIVDVLKPHEVLEDDPDINVSKIIDENFDRFTEVVDETNAEDLSSAFSKKKKKFIVKSKSFSKFYEKSYSEWDFFDLFLWLKRIFIQSKYTKKSNLSLEDLTMNFYLRNYFPDFLNFINRKFYKMRPRNSVMIVLKMVLAGDSRKNMDVIFKDKNSEREKIFSVLRKEILKVEENGGVFYFQQYKVLKKKIKRVLHRLQRNKGMVIRLDELILKVERDQKYLYDIRFCRNRVLFLVLSSFKTLNQFIIRANDDFQKIRNVVKSVCGFGMDKSEVLKSLSEQVDNEYYYRFRKMDEKKIEELKRGFLQVFKSSDIDNCMKTENSKEYKSYRFVLCCKTFEAVNGFNFFNLSSSNYVKYKGIELDLMMSNKKTSLSWSKKEEEKLSESILKQKKHLESKFHTNDILEHELHKVILGYLKDLDDSNSLVVKVKLLLSKMHLRRNSFSSSMETFFIKIVDRIASHPSFKFGWLHAAVCIKNCKLQFYRNELLDFSELSEDDSFEELICIEPSRQWRFHSKKSLIKRFEEISALIVYWNVYFKYSSWKMSETKNNALEKNCQEFALDFLEEFELSIDNTAFLEDFIKKYIKEEKGFYEFVLRLDPSFLKKEEQEMYSLFRKTFEKEIHELKQGDDENMNDKKDIIFYYQAQVQEFMESLKKRDDGVEKTFKPIWTILNRQLEEFKKTEYQMTFLFDERFLNKFREGSKLLEQSTNNRVSFYTHEELDGFLCELFDVCPKNTFCRLFQKEWDVLKGFCNAFSLQHRRKKRSVNTSKICPFAFRREHIVPFKRRVENFSSDNIDVLDSKGIRLFVTYEINKKEKRKKGFRVKNMKQLKTGILKNSKFSFLREKKFLLVDAKGVTLDPNSERGFNTLRKDENLKIFIT